MPYYVYQLVDPRTGTPHYVGITDNLTRRRWEHINLVGASNQAREAWIRELREKRLVPRIEVIDTAEEWEEVLEREKYWIQFYIQQGVPLLNIAGNPRRRNG